MSYRVFSDFPTAPDFNEILMDGTVFHADSNGMFFSRNEKSYSYSKLFFLSICDCKSQIIFLTILITAIAGNF